MKCLMSMGILPLSLLLLQTCSSDFANESPATVTDNATDTAKNASDLIAKLDRLVEQNLYHSPVGYTSVPFALGGTGSVFHTNLEAAF